MAELPCASIARSFDEPLHATASIVRSWVLLEQPGPWGSDALTQSRLPLGVGLELKRRGREQGVRILLLRTPGPSPTDGYHCFIAHSGHRSRWIEQGVLADPSDLLRVDLTPLRRGDRVGFGALREEPLYLVCTNGRHDPCCARWGRPLVRALLPRVGSAVWECTHVGGDRFAGNLVCLPEGLYFGRVGPDDAVRVVESYERGILDLDHYRGRAGDPYPVQAAEYFVRRIAGLRGVADLTPERYRQIARDGAEVDLMGPGGRLFRVVVGIDRAGDERPLTCATLTRVQRPPTYSLLSLTEVGRDAKR